MVDHPIPLPLAAIAVTALLGLLAWLRAGNADRRRAAEVEGLQAADTLRREADRRAERTAAQVGAEAAASDFYVFADFDYGPVRVRFTKKPGDAQVVDSRVIAHDAASGRTYGPFCCDTRVLRGVASGSTLWPADQVLGGSPDSWRTLQGWAYWVSDGHVFRSPLRVYPNAEQGRLFDTDLHVRECLGALADGAVLPS